MAINTAIKRRAVASIGDTTSIPGVTPDSTPGKMWRATVAWGYFLVGGGGGGGGDGADVDQVTLGAAQKGLGVHSSETMLGSL